MSIASALYVGSVVHRRLRPRKHDLRYRVFWLFLDIDTMQDTMRRSIVMSFNRFNLFSIREKDYGDRSGAPLRPQVEAAMREAGVTPDGGRIFLLTMPRVLGYGFNPLSIYFCYRRDETLAALLYEVSNTFGQRHSYVLPVETDDSVVRQSIGKCFYVSPFMDMDLSYSFRVRRPEDKVAVSIRCDDGEGAVLTASLIGERRPLGDLALLSAFVTHPFLTLKVTGGIHWEALLLWMKGIGLRKRPPPPARPLTTAQHSSS
ncbi:hypothetical protein GGR34_002133 [Microvirga flocculans]|uniref:DUF1365 domain-containing protein n=1 Tax=Microvirga flocculans TaxID=217168 RepID=A0A7W6IGM8_9HYPH|nr:DUF1365 domain-containing protein [Microvirga flocculans]MBB4040480.1 hypothetical protein [Microvirga flocculans]